MSDITHYTGGRGRYRLSRISKKRRVKWGNMRAEQLRFPNWSNSMQHQTCVHVPENQMGPPISKNDSCNEKDDGSAVQYRLKKRKNLL